MITCRCCLKEKQDDEFYKQSFRGKVYTIKCCIKCARAYQQKRRDKSRQTKSYYKEIQSITNAVKAMIPRHKGIKITAEQFLSSRLFDKSIRIGEDIY